jgi:hypothetical protein
MNFKKLIKDSIPYLLIGIFVIITIILFYISKLDPNKGLLFTGQIHDLFAVISANLTFIATIFIWLTFESQRDQIKYLINDSERREKIENFSSLSPIYYDMLKDMSEGILETDFVSFSGSALDLYKRLKNDTTNVESIDRLSIYFRKAEDELKYTDPKFMLKEKITGYAEIYNSYKEIERYAFGINYFNMGKIISGKPDPSSIKVTYLGYIGESINLYFRRQAAIEGLRSELNEASAPRVDG